MYSIVYTGDNNFSFFISIIIPNSNHNAGVEFDQIL